MTVFRARPWFLPTSLAAFLTEAWPDGPADDPSDSRPDTRPDTAPDAPSDAPSDGPSDTPPDTRSADSGATDRRSHPDPSGTLGKAPDKPADRP
ncbi:hypothetical protein Stube_62980 [Streptomyces tubercidicus]|uniref:Uncharacterized protein n=1 Tax=Streptomyces tubercidicus TaxID=47759 RepID=A0A640V401_9ACTN|nr:hypothetical protein Stube_62980 [Streptomyces tubercidicus]